MAEKRIALVAEFGPTAVGTHFASAAHRLGHEAVSLDYSPAYAGALPVQKVNWWLRGKRPPRLSDFSERVLAECRKTRPDVVIATGFAPLTDNAVASIRSLGMTTAIYLTDDPWNPRRRSPWFIRALPRYDYVFSTRKSNLVDLSRIGCTGVRHLPFAYAPEIHFPESPTDEAAGKFDVDVAFVGGADRDRLPYMEALIKASFDVALYGGYWGRHRITRPFARGHVDVQTARRAIGGARVAPCLVRRANRDGSSMRSFEVPAMGGCPVVEDTAEHRELFGPEGDSVLYFETPADLVERVRFLIDHPNERGRLTLSAHSLITDNGHSYADRLEAILRTTA